VAAWGRKPIQITAQVAFSSKTNFDIPLFYCGIICCNL
jgi:hypothetical protein